MTTLGRLERVDLRMAWADEANEFTPWLASEDNITLLGETIGVDLEVEGTERGVGPFRADILCRDSTTSHWVLIENQLERTDHLHLGQLLTYAAGLQAVTIVWIAARFTEEHRATLDWLNDITDESFQFFGLEVELWRIGDSISAPKFNVISAPNDWTRTISKAAARISDEGLTETQLQHQRYWEAMAACLTQRQSSIRSQKPPPRRWTNYGIGRSYFGLSATTNSRDRRIGVYVYIGGDDAKKFFYLFEKQKDEIEHELGFQLDWQRLPDLKFSLTAIYKENTDPTDEDDWPNQHRWMADTLERFNSVFRPRVRGLDLSNWTPEEEADEGTA